MNFYDVVRGKRYLILDTETTGLANAEIVQIAIINDQGAVLLDTLVKPVKPIPADATRVHGITNDHVASAPGWAEVAPLVEKLLDDQHLIIYNAAFDTAAMHSASIHAGIEWKLKFHSINCAMEAFAEYHGDWNEYHQSYKWKPLQFAARSAGAEVEGAHNALGDCKMTLQVCQFLAQVQEENETDEDAAWREADEDEPYIW